MKWPWLMTLTLFPCLVRAATQESADASYANVLAAYNACSDGDTLLIRGVGVQHNWTSTLTVTKNIVIQGEGAGLTIIGHAVAANKVLYWDYSAKSNARPRLTGIEFRDAGGDTASDGAVIRFNGGNSENGNRLRFDNCKIVNLNGTCRYDDVIGVVDHNTFERTRSGFPNSSYMRNYGGAGLFTNGAWAAGPDFGSEKWLFFESNTLTNLGTGVASICDGYEGTRYVVRNNTMTGYKVEMHGTDSGSSGFRGSVAAEVYNNVFHGFSNSNQMCYIRSGSWLIHDNSVDGYGAPTMTLVIDRLHGDLPSQSWDGADGQSDFDVNYPNGGTNDNPTPFYTGTATANSASSVVSVTPSMTSGAFNGNNGYMISRTTNLGAVTTCHFAPVVSNTANSITWDDGAGFFCNKLTVANGDTVVVYRIQHCLDQPGRTGGSFITGNPPTQTGANNQTTSACYEWNNNLGAQDPHFSTGETTIRSGEHYKNSTQFVYTPYTFPHPLTVGGAGTKIYTPFFKK